MDSQAAAILQKLKNRKFEPVYFLQGEETYYIDRISDYIELKALEEHEKSFNQIILYGKDVNVITVLNQARRFPMMSERQVVIVKEAQEIIDLNREEGARYLLDYLKNPVPSTILVFCHKHKSLDKRRELGKSIDKLCVAANFKKIYDNQLPAFISMYLAENNLNMEDKAIQVLAEFVGNDLHRITNEIDKIFIGQKTGTVISATQVMLQVGISKEYNIFELQKAIISKNSFTAQKMARYFASNTKKNPMIPLVAFLYAFFSKLLIAATSGVSSDKELVSRLKISPYAAKDYMQAMRNYTKEKIISNLHLLKEADLALKGVNSTDNDGESFRELVYRLIN
jgi:DNA polymerase III subunit delta